MSTALKYTGGGFGGFLPGIPARDLTAAEVEELGGVKVLLETGLYIKHTVKRKNAKDKKEVK